MKNRTTAGLLALFLGGLGIHRFYLGQGGAGFLYLLFCWTFIPSIIAFFDGIIILSMGDLNFNNKYNTSLVGSPNVTSDAVVSQNQHNHKYDSLERIQGLLEKGIITQEEFDLEKKNILGK